MGVSLALRKLEQALDAMSVDYSPARICTLGPIIHNPQVLQAFAARGVVCLEHPDEARENDLILIRAHGVPRAKEEALRTRGATIKDATCPKVKKAQMAIAESCAKFHPEASPTSCLLLFGEAAHPEVRGLVSYAPGPALIFGSRSELESLELDPSWAYILAAQTTQDRGAFEGVKDLLRARLPHLEVLDTICDATRQRQEEARRIAQGVDAMVIIGGRESGNTRRLASVAAACGVESFHVERIEELDGKRFAQKSRIGLTAGASTPKSLIDAAEFWLASL